MARAALSGLTAAETQALFMLVGPAAAVAPEAKAALRKLVRALDYTTADCRLPHRPIAADRRDG